MIPFFKLIKYLDKFIQPSKYKLNNIIKPIRKLQLNDKVFLIMIPHAISVHSTMKNILLDYAHVKYIPEHTRDLIQLFFDKNNIHPIFDSASQYNHLFEKTLRTYTSYIPLKHLKKNIKSITLQNSGEMDFILTTDKTIIKNIILHKSKDIKALINSNQYIVYEWGNNYIITQEETKTKLIKLHKQYTANALYKLTLL